jgi:hypothetical protein
MMTLPRELALDSTRWTAALRSASLPALLLLSGCVYSVGDLVSTGSTTSTSTGAGGSASINLLQNPSFEQWGAGGSTPLAWDVDGCDLTRTGSPAKVTDGAASGHAAITTDFGRFYQDVYFDPPLVTTTLEAGIDIAYESGQTDAPPTLTLLLRFKDGAAEEDPFQQAIWHVDGSWGRVHLEAKVAHPIDHLGFRVLGDKAGQAFLVDAASLTAAPGP